MKSEAGSILHIRTENQYRNLFCKQKSFTKKVSLIGALAEKAKVWQDNPGKGTRQISPVSLQEGVPSHV